MSNSVISPLRLSEPSSSAKALWHPLPLPPPSPPRKFSFVIPILSPPGLPPPPHSDKSYTGIHTLRDVMLVPSVIGRECHGRAPRRNCYCSEKKERCRIQCQLRLETLGAINDKSRHSYKGCHGQWQRECHVRRTRQRPTKVCARRH